MTSRFKLAAVLLVLGALAACGPSPGDSCASHWASAVLSWRVLGQGQAKAPLDSPCTPDGSGSRVVSG